jgi:hypothetical protein
MTRAKLAKEVVVRMHNDIGVLAQVAKLIADKGINILALSAWVEGENAVIRMVTDENLRAMDALRGERFNPRENEVVLVEIDHKPGMLRKITERLAREGIDLHHLYVSGSEHAPSCLVVFSSAHNERALLLFPT